MPIEIRQNHIPDAKPITEFLTRRLPKESCTIILSKPRTWFSSDMPNADITSLMSRPIPPGPLSDLLPSNHACPASSSAYAKNQGDWVEEQLNNKETSGADREALDAMSGLFDTLGWRSKIWGQWTNLDLAKILSWEWLSDDHIDMMMSDLSAQAVKKGSNVKYTKKNTPLLARYEEHIKKMGDTQLYFPIHINNNHWIAALIDFKCRLIATGDSRVGKSKAPVKFIKDLKRWLHAGFGEKEFTYQRDTLDHGDQKDITSCSIACRNTIAAAALCEEIWEQEHAAGARANCFMRLVHSAAIRSMFLSPEPHSF
ncbi:hypothetical protein B0H10DRAFT_1968386 [Mycena sp. CBHHK59/15]|nr:hypothetical protein B0H10DRAFT_1968386 [Mycena sp. CBHHK59/15]